MTDPRGNPAPEVDDSQQRQQQVRLLGLSSQQIPSQRKKRELVLAACQSCRQKKIKCDASRPCGACTRRGWACQYDTHDGETYSQAAKRKYHEISNSYQSYEDLFNLIRLGSSRDAAEIVQLIRCGQRPEAILKSFRTENLIMPDPRRLAHGSFLITLAHSSGSLRDITRLAASTIDFTSDRRLPDPKDYTAFRNRVVHLPDVEALLHGPGRIMGGPSNSANQSTMRLCDTNETFESRMTSAVLNGDDLSQCDYPLHQVPAVPWTTITMSDEAVSHLVSLFLAWINPTWRFVEQDLFLIGIRSQRLSSTFCSQFLLNSICAIACLHSEHDIAFAHGDRDRITRGQHFHDEALRLWAAEEYHPTLTNVQALCILALESNYRAKDRLGLTLIPIAVQLNNQIPVADFPIRFSDQGLSQRDLTRARLATHWTAKCTYVIMLVAFMHNKTVEVRTSGLPRIHDTFDDVVEGWIGYPLNKNVVPHRPTLYLKERCKLTEISQDLHTLLINDRQCETTIQDFTWTVDSLSARLAQWHQSLPFELQYAWPMSVAVWELHASYHVFHMILLLVARNRYYEEEKVSDRSSPSENAGERMVRSAQKTLNVAIVLAQKAAQMLLEFRQRYGLKITPAWLLQLQAVTASVLVLDPELTDPVTAASPQAVELKGTIRDSHTAFDEVFRCLLGTGVEVMIARGIARMVYHTALRQKIVLSRSTRMILQLMSDTAWRPSDLSLVNSVFPDFTASKGHEDNAGLSELLSKWEMIEI